MAEKITIYEPDERYLPAPGNVDTVLERLQAVDAIMNEAPDDGDRGALAKAAASAAASIEAIRVDTYRNADTVLRRAARAEGALQGALGALRSNALGAADAALDLNAQRGALLDQALNKVAAEVYEQTKARSAELANTALASLKKLETWIAGAKARAMLPVAMSADEDLLSLSRRASVEQEILAQRRPAQYVRDTYAALVDSGQDEDAAFFARCSISPMIMIRDSTPAQLKQRYANDSADALSSERTIAWGWLAEQERAKKEAIAQSSIAYAEQAFSILRELFVLLVGAHPQWLTRAQRQSMYMVDAGPKAAWDTVFSDFPLRFLPPRGTPIGWSRAVTKTRNGAIVREPKG